MKITIDQLEFNSDHFYVQTNSIVEKISFNNRTFYSKYEKYPTPINPILLKQYKNSEVSLALPLIEKSNVNYLVIEYMQNDWEKFYALIQHLLKILNIKEYSVYRTPEKNLLQIFISRPNTPVEIAYKEVEEIKLILERKSKKSYKIFPNSNLPLNYNIITFPLEKI